MWRLCISYTTLNTITKYFIFPIPYCVNFVENVDESNDPILFTTLVLYHDYHQSSVRYFYIKKLTLFIPGSSKKTLVVTLVVSKNTPSFNIATIKDFKYERDTYFKAIHSYISQIQTLRLHSIIPHIHNP